MGRVDGRNSPPLDASQHTGELIVPSTGLTALTVDGGFVTSPTSSLPPHLAARDTAKFGLSYGSPGVQPGLQADEMAPRLHSEILKYNLSNRVYCAGL